MARIPDKSCLFCNKSLHLRHFRRAFGARTRIFNTCNFCAFPDTYTSSGRMRGALFPPRILEQQAQLLRAASWDKAIRLRIKDEIEYCIRILRELKKGPCKGHSALSSRNIRREFFSKYLALLRHISANLRYIHLSEGGHLNEGEPNTLSTLSTNPVFHMHAPEYPSHADRVRTVEALRDIYAAAAKAALTEQTTTEHLNISAHSREPWVLTWRLR
jgi:hypothetical protein